MRSQDDDGQEQIGSSESEKTEADVGQTVEDADGPEDVDSAVPEDAEGLFADARRITELIHDGVTIEEGDLVVNVTIDRNLMDHDRAREAIRYAVEEKGLLIRTDDGLEKA